MTRRKALQASIAAAAAVPALLQAAPSVFSPPQDSTVSVLTELLIPGAAAARVNRYLDLFLAAGPAPSRLRFLHGLDWLDAHATALYSEPFIACTPAQQSAILESLDSAPTSGPLAPGARFFRETKSLTSTIFFNTEAGYRFLNQGGRVPTTLGCHEPVS
jgi:gluconate 2-dehydrogenase gamma chain